MSVKKPEPETVIFVLFILIMVGLFFLLSGCAAPVRADPPIASAVPMMRAEAEVKSFQPEVKPFHVEVVELFPDQPVSKRLAVYNPDFWDYPYRDWVASEIPEGEPWDGWTATTATGKVTVEWEYSTELLYGGIELSADLENWYRGRCLEHFYFSTKDGRRREKVSFITVADPVTGKTDKQFVRLNFPFVDSLEGVNP